MQFIQKADSDFNASLMIERRATLHAERSVYRPRMPAILKGLFDVVESGPTQCLTEVETVKRLFPNTFGQPKVHLNPRKGGEPMSPYIGRKFNVSYTHIFLAVVAYSLIAVVGWSRLFWRPSSWRA